MAITVTSKEFNQQASQILKLSEQQPVFITKWGKIVSVLSSYKDYQQAQLTELSFEQLFTPQAESVNADAFAEFEQTLNGIRQMSSPRSAEFD